MFYSCLQIHIPTQILLSLIQIFESELIEYFYEFILLEYS